MQSSGKHNTPRKGKGQDKDSPGAIFSKQATGFLELSTFPGPASAISLRSQIQYFADPRNQQSQRTHFFIEFIEEIVHLLGTQLLHQPANLSMTNCYIRMAGVS